MDNLSSEMTEVAFNTKYQNRILLKLDPGFHANKSLKNRLINSLKVLSPGCNINELLNAVEEMSVFSKRDKNILLLELRPSYRNDFLSFLKEHRTKESQFKFISFIHHTTRLKKNVLGHISKKMCNEVKGRACVPRYSLRANLVIQESETGNRQWLSYKEVVTNESYMKYLTDQEKSEFRK